MITIAEALLKEADSQEHAAYLAAVGEILASAAYSPANDRTLSRTRSDLQQAHLQHCEIAGRILRRVSIAHWDTTDGVILKMEPFVPPAYLNRQS